MEIPNQAMFHPIKFGNALAMLAEKAGAKIFTNSKVLTIENLTAKTLTGEVKAQDIIIATYRPITNEGTHFKKGLYDSYVYELEIKKGIISEGMYLDMHNPYHYFRVDDYGHNSRMVLGGEDHRRAIKINPEKNFKALGEYAQKLLPVGSFKIIKRWQSGVLEPSDGLPLIGAIKPHVFAATAFSGNGMTYAALSGLIIRDLIIGHTNPYIELYDPKRTLKIKALLIKGRDYTVEFLGGAFKNLFH